MQTSLGTQLFMLKWDFIPRSLSGKSKSFHHEMPCARTRFWNWKESNSEMAYWIFLFFLLQPAKWTTRRARWPIVHLTVVKATQLCNEIQGSTTKPQQDQPINEAFELVASFGATFVCFCSEYVCLTLYPQMFFIWVWMYLFTCVRNTSFHFNKNLKYVEFRLSCHKFS